MSTIMTNTLKKSEVRSQSEKTYLKNQSELKLILKQEKEILLLEKLIIKNILNFETEINIAKTDSKKKSITQKFILKEKQIHLNFSKEIINKVSKSLNPKLKLINSELFNLAFSTNQIIKLSKNILNQKYVNKNKDKTISNLAEALNKKSTNFNSNEINSKLDNITTKLNEDISTTNLKQIYENNIEELKQWIFNGKKLKNSNLKTKKEHIRKIKRIFENEIKTVYDFNKLRDTNPQIFLSRPNVNFRTFIEFCRNRGKLNENIALTILSKVEGKVKVNIDNYVPTEKEILESLKSIKNYYKDKPHYYILYKLFIESGGRWEGSIQKMLLNFDETKLKHHDGFVTYDLFYDLDEKNNIIKIVDKTKLSFFLFMRTKTFNELMKYKKEIFDKNFLNNYKKYLSRDSNKKDEKTKLNNFIYFKSIRKFVRTKLVKSGISSEFADFIESRTDGAGGNIGFRIYQDKAEAVVEYKKYLKYLEEVFD